MAKTIPLSIKVRDLEGFEERIKKYCKNHMIDVVSVENGIINLIAADPMDYFHLGVHLGTMDAQSQFQ